MGQGDYESVAQVYVSEGGIIAQMNSTYGNITIPDGFSIITCGMYNVDVNDIVDMRGSAILEVT